MFHDNILLLQGYSFYQMADLTISFILYNWLLLSITLRNVRYSFPVFNVGN